MFLKFFGFVVLLNCVVQRSLSEDARTNQFKYISLKEAAILTRQNESMINDSGDSLSTEFDSNLDTPLPNDDNKENETISTTESSATSDNSTEVTVNEIENNTNVTENQTEIPTNIETETLTDIETEISTDIETEISTDIASESSSSESELSTESSPEQSTETEPSTELIPEQSTVTDSSNEPIPEESSETELSPTETTNTSPESSSPEPETTTIDPKYRNETFELYLEDFLGKNPSARLFTSPGFPLPYDENLNISHSVTLTNCTGIDVIVHYLDLNPLSPDTLNFRGGHENSTTEKGVKLTGHNMNIQKFKITHTTNLFIWFNTGRHTFTEYQGFVLTYSPYGDNTPPVTTTEAPVTVPISQLQSIEVQLVLPKFKQNNSTWQKFKEILASSACDYVIDHDLHVERAHPENVTIVVIQNCPDNWPNYETCIRFEFAIALWNLDFDPEVDFDLSIFDYELSSSSLYDVWNLYGRDRFFTILGIEEYLIPDGTYILLLWTGISLAIIVIFIAVLYGIWRIDILREYRRMYDKSYDQQDILKDKSELDISMYPIPHQPYPTLFETNEMNSTGYYELSENNPTSFHLNNFYNDIHADKPMTPNSSRHSVDHFSPNIMEFNDSPFFPDDEETFGRVPSMSPRSKQKLLVLGAKREESIT